jgi:hypothetical protein
MDGQDLMDVQLLCDYKRAAALRHSGAQKMAESSRETVRGHGGALDVNVFAKIKGGGSGNLTQWLWRLTVVTRNLAATTVLERASTMVGAAFGGAPSLGALPTVAVGPGKAPPGEESTWEVAQKRGEGTG